jgi:hypothetical protein
MSPTQGARTIMTTRSPLDVADRQRMLSQRIVLFALLASRGDGSALPVAQEALLEFRRSHATLIKGRDKSLTDELQRIATFIRVAEETLVHISRHPPSAERGLRTLAAHATPILEWLASAARAEETATA